MGTFVAPYRYSRAVTVLVAAPAGNRDIPTCRELIDSMVWECREHLRAAVEKPVA
jgi:hypothetical protein